MLERLSFKNVGPSPEMSLDFGERLNLLTGDNGMGKTFILDAAWWALTRTWSENGILEPDPPSEADKHPLDPEAIQPEIGYVIWGVDGPMEPFQSTFDFGRHDWRIKRGRPPIPGLIIYARVDGGFSIWDPARNYWRADEEDATSDANRPSSYQFSREQIWWGLWRTPKDEYEKNRDTVICRGLLEDIVSWQLDPAEKETKALLENVLSELSPHPEESLQFGPLVEQWGRPGKVPTLRMASSDRLIPLERASAGVKRAIALAYALVWAWTSHRKAMRQTRGNATAANRIVLLFDEIEAHLHPRWQRQILPALLQAVKSHLLTGEGIPVQVIGTTHAPLVTASVETMVDQETDRLFNLQLGETGKVSVEEVPWAKFGDASGWLMSPAFGMESGYSEASENAIRSADDLMAGYENGCTVEEINRALSDSLDGSHPYWTLWLPYYREKTQGVA